LSRAADYHTAMANAMLAYRFLHGKAGITLTAIDELVNQYVNTIEAISIPQSVGQDEKGLFNISTNYVFKLQAA
jgi:predicted metal-dependent peptidase